MSETNQAPAGDAKETTKAPVGKAKAQTASDENKELKRQLKESKRQNEEKDMKIVRLETAPEAEPSDEIRAVIEDLQRQVKEIRKADNIKPVIGRDGKPSKYRPVRPEDIGEDAITFTARCVNKAIPGYLDDNRVEVLAPHDMILLTYAASDIRRDGKEENILTFCSYTTKLISEIEFLRSHPEYNQTFGENMNEVAGHDPKEYQFKTMAAEQVASMSPESVDGYAKMLNVKNRATKPNKVLKDIILRHLVEEYKKKADDLQDDLKNRLLAQAAKVIG